MPQLLLQKTRVQFPESVLGNSQLPVTVMPALGIWCPLLFSSSTCTIHITHDVHTHNHTLSKSINRSINQSINLFFSFLKVKTARYGSRFFKSQHSRDTSLQAHLVCSQGQPGLQGEMLLKKKGRNNLWVQSTLHTEFLKAKFQYFKFFTPILTTVIHYFTPIFSKIASELRIRSFLQVSPL